jgi:NAD(P)-dependent dehydrogenase (short-subunit alcohol dehydrogenase family)
MNLQGKTILITGAAGGLGGALALHCAREGAELVLLDKNRRGLSELGNRMTEEGLPEPGLFPLDLAGAGTEEFNGLVDVIQSEFGGLNALIHCALDFDGLQPLDQIEPQKWLQSMQVNLNAPWLLSCACLSMLKQAESGRLFFLVDNPERVTDAYWGPYGVAKVALAGLVKQFAATLSNTSVLVRGIDPGPMRTGFRAKVYHAENPMDQPDPVIAAGKIAEMLSEDQSESELITRLS